MKKKWIAIALGLLLLCGLAGCGGNGDETQPPQTTAQTETPTTEPEQTEPVTEATDPMYPYDFTDERSLAYRDILEHIPKAPIQGVRDNGAYYEQPGDGLYTVMQGGCSDGKYIYLILNAPTLTQNGVALDTIYKVDSNTWEVVNSRSGLPLDHGNGITYNSKTNQLIVVHYYTNNISFVDPETLEITGTKTLNMRLYSLAYNAQRDLYVGGINGTNGFSILDPDFVELGFYDGHDLGLGNQSVACDDDYIYVGNSGVSKNPGMEVVKVYNWDGKYMGIYRVDSVSEQEAIITAGDKYYITFYTGNGGRLYEITFDKSLLAE